MTRALLPGRWNRHGRAVPLNACTGNCNQGRSPCTCQVSQTELANTHAPRLELVRSVPSRPPIQMQRYPTPRIKRAKRFFRDLWAFITAPRFRP